MQNTSKILFIGDIVGRSGRIVTSDFLSKIDKTSYDLIVANVENASHGFGLTQKNHDEILSWGVNIMTSGNHIWDKKDIYSFIDNSSALIRPYNYHKSVPGVGYRIFKDKYIILNFLGKTFMPPVPCPFNLLDNALDEIKKTCNIEDKIIFIDFHAEATAEKICFAKHACELGVACVVGTHTHVPTADETIYNSKTAYITDVGFCGSTEGVIGMEYRQSYNRILTSINERFEVETLLPYVLNAVEIEFQGNNAVSIKRIKHFYNGEQSQNEN